MDGNSTITVRDGLEAMDFPRVAAMLAGAYWSMGISLDEVVRGARNSALVVGAFSPSGEQVGYARVISDKTRFAYILDVYVAEECRGRGIGRRMIRHMLEHEDLEQVYQWLLFTRDAHDFYARFGFSPTARPGDMLEIRRDRAVARGASKGAAL